jgi:4-hydroxy-4-methyl-2-oxoglutarate aldolase
VINEFNERPAAEVVQGFRNLFSYDSVTCAISDCMGRFNAMTSDMRPLFEGIRLAGTAVTVKTLAADRRPPSRQLMSPSLVTLWSSILTGR